MEPLSEIRDYMVLEVLRLWETQSLGFEKSRTVKSGEAAAQGGAQPDLDVGIKLTGPCANGQQDYLFF